MCFLLAHVLSSLSTDSPGPLQLLRHCSRPLVTCGSLLPHPLLLLPSWWGRPGCRGRGGRRWCQRWPWIQWQKGAGHLLCHMGIGCSSHIVLVMPVNFQMPVITLCRADIFNSKDNRSSWTSSTAKHIFKICNDFMVRPSSMIVIRCKNYILYFLSEGVVTIDFVLNSVQFIHMWITEQSTRENLVNKILKMFPTVFNSHHIVLSHIRMQNKKTVQAFSY